MATNVGIRATLNLPYEQAVQKTTDALKAEGFSVKAVHNGIPNFSVLDGWWIEEDIAGITGWSI